MKRAILLSRVSTEGQDLIQQNDALYKYAATFGYEPDECELICEKESGINLSEMERKGLNRMKDYIEVTPTIECVFAYEVSRIGRRSEVNYSIRRYLQDHHVQLRIQNLCIKCFNEQTWQLDEQGNMLFSIFNAIAENEMLDKKARMLRGKQAKREQGLFGGGGELMYGYYTDKNKVIHVDEEKAVLIRLIFNMYVQDGLSSTQIAKELLERGLLWQKTHSAARTWVSIVLRNHAYKGGCSKDNYSACKDGIVKFGYIYPAIVSEKIWEAANKKRAANRTRVNPRDSKHEYIAKDLVYTHDGHKMSAYYGRNVYGYRNVDTGYNTHVNMCMIESLAWYHAVQVLNANKTDDIKAVLHGMFEKRKEYFDKHAVACKQKAHEEDALDRINYLFVNGRIDIDKMCRMQDEKKKVIAEYERTANKYMTMANELSIQMEDTAKYGDRDYASVTDVKERRELVHKVVSRILVTKVGVTEYNVDIDGTKYIMNTHQLVRQIHKDGKRVTFEYITVK